VHTGTNVEGTDPMTVIEYIWGAKERGYRTINYAIYLMRPMNKIRNKVATLRTTEN
jgi:hypothetical protein